jgi:hypothetical protein
MHPNFHLSYMYGILVRKYKNVTITLQKERENPLKICFCFQTGLKSLSTCLPVGIEIVPPFSTTVQPSVMLTYQEMGHKSRWLIRKWVTSHTDLSGNGSQLMLTYQEMDEKSCWLIRKWITCHVDLSGKGSQVMLTCQEMDRKSCWLIRKWMRSHVDL